MCQITEGKKSFKLINNCWLLLKSIAVNCAKCFQGLWSRSTYHWDSVEICHSGLWQAEDPDFSTTHIRWGDRRWRQVDVRLIAGSFPLFGLCVFLTFHFVFSVSTLPCALCVTCLVSALDTEIALWSEVTMASLAQTSRLTTTRVLFLQHKTVDTPGLRRI